MSEMYAAVVDWGTSSFRAWLLDADGAVRGKSSNQLGMAKLQQNEFGPHLEAALQEMEAPTDIPVLMCGMVGAAQGWHQAPYLEAPARLSEIPAQSVRVPDIDRDVRILPGICQKQAGRWDVMRGEETLLYGATFESKSPIIVCLPGTHSKWATISDGSVTSFSTAMTGELFSLLSEKSTLAAYTPARTDQCNWTSFDEAVEEAFMAPQSLLNKLFSIRSMPLLLKGDTAKRMPDRLSGLLIGQEIAGMNIDKQSSVTLLANGELAERYERAMRAFGIKPKIMDATLVAQKGLFHAATQIWSRD